MTEPLTNLDSYSSSHSTFGGIVYLSDYDTTHSAGNIAKRISRDLKFDESCREYIKNIQEKGGNRHD